MYAVIKTGGKQYCVQEGDILNVEKLEAAEGETVELGDVFVLKKENEDLIIGNPLVEGAKVFAQVLEHGRGKKIIVFKYKPKKNYRRKQGHRQPYTKLHIQKIDA